MSMDYTYQKFLAPKSNNDLKKAYDEFAKVLNKIKSPCDKHNNNNCYFVPSIEGFSNQYIPSSGGSEANDSGFSGYPGSALR
jgi:hypothetical protein